MKKSRLHKWNFAIQSASRKDLIFYGNTCFRTKKKYDWFLFYYASYYQYRVMYYSVNMISHNIRGHQSITITNRHIHAELHVFILFYLSHHDNKTQNEKAKMKQFSNKRFTTKASSEPDKILCILWNIACLTFYMV